MEEIIMIMIMIIAGRGGVFPEDLHQATVPVL